MNRDELILTASTKRTKEQELNYLRTAKRQELTELLKRAREYGDLSENFEYQAARQAQAINNAKIAELEAILDRARIVEDEDLGGDTVGLGATVSVRDLDEDEVYVYKIVDSTSADPDRDWISYSSPLGQALMNRAIGDIVEVAFPDGRARYSIQTIDYTTS